MSTEVWQMHRALRFAKSGWGDGQGGVRRVRSDEGRGACEIGANGTGGTLDSVSVGGLSKPSQRALGGVEEADTW